MAKLPFLSFGGWGVCADDPEIKTCTLVQPDGVVFQDEVGIPLNNAVVGAFAYLRANIRVCRGEKNVRVVSGWRRGESK